MKVTELPPPYNKLITGPRSRTWLQTRLVRIVDSAENSPKGIELSLQVINTFLLTKRRVQDMTIREQERSVEKFYDSIPDINFIKRVSLISAVAGTSPHRILPVHSHHSKRTSNCN